MKGQRRWWGAAALVGAVAGGLASPSAASAQDAVVAIRSAGELLGDVRYLVQATVPEDRAGPVLRMLDQFAGPDALKGLDRTRPIAVMASLPAAEGDSPMVVGAVPTTDLNALLDNLRGMGLAVADAADAPGFSHQITLPDGNTTLFVTSANNYAYVTPSTTHAAKIKAMKPADWMPERPDGADISLMGRLGRLPEPMKRQFLERMKLGMASEMDRKPDESDAEFHARTTGIKLVEEAFSRVVQDASVLAMDLAIDEETQQVSLELSLAARPGTPMAESLKGFAHRKSRFRALGAGAPVAGWMSLPIPEQFRTVIREAIAEGRKKAEADADSPDQKQLIADMSAAIESSFTGDSFDYGLAVQGPLPRAGGDPEFVLVGGIQVVDGKKVEQVIREAWKKAKPEARAKVQPEFAKAADGTAIHRLEVDELDEDAAKIFGEDAAGYVAFRDDVIYLAFGGSGPAALEDALSAKPAPAAPGAVEAPVALVARASKMAGMVQENQAAAARAAAEVFAGPAADKDRIVLSLGGDGGTLRLRFAVDVPALSFFARVGSAMRQGEAAIQVRP